MADLPDFYIWTEAIVPVKITLDHGADANKSATPVVGAAYCATNTGYFYLCLTDGNWTKVSAQEVADHAAIAAAHHAKYTNVEAKTQAEGAKLDDHAVPDDNTDLNASAAKHGLMPKASVTKLAGIATGADVTGNNAPKAHKASHQNGGADKISIVGLSGLAADDQHVLDAEVVAAVKADAGLPVVTLTLIIDGAGSAITTGEKGHLEIPFSCTINAVTMLAYPSGSIVVDIWKDTYANFPPTNADSITASAPPTITTAVKSQDSTLTGWTTAIAAGDVLAFNVDSCTTITRVTISLKVTKT
jgi:hypothetical protein